MDTVHILVLVPASITSAKVSLMDMVDILVLVPASMTRHPFHLSVCAAFSVNQ